MTPPPEGGYTVTSPLLPELISEGGTICDTLENVRDALAAVIELYVELGRSLPQSTQKPDTGGPCTFRSTSCRGRTLRMPRFACSSTEFTRAGSPRRWWRDRAPAGTRDRDPPDAAGGRRHPATGTPRGAPGDPGGRRSLLSLLAGEAWPATVPSSSSTRATAPCATASGSSFPAIRARGSCTTCGAAEPSCTTWPPPAVTRYGAKCTATMGSPLWRGAVARSAVALGELKREPAGASVRAISDRIDCGDSIRPLRTGCRCAQRDQHERGDSYVRRIWQVRARPRTAWCTCRPQSK